MRASAAAAARSRLAVTSAFSISAFCCLAAACLCKGVGARAPLRTHAVLHHTTVLSAIKPLSDNQKRQYDTQGRKLRSKFVSVGILVAAQRLR